MTDLRTFALVLGGLLAASAHEAKAQGAPTPGKRSFTLQQVITLAQQQGLQSKAATATREAARQRDRSYNARLLPQLSIGGSAPNYNRSIIPVLQPDGSTLYKPQQQTESSMSMTIAQRIPFTGGDLTVSSGLNRLQVTGTTSIQTWSSTPLTIGLRQPIFRPNTIKWDTREQDLRSDIAERQFLESREDVASAATTAFFDLYAAKMALKNAISNANINDTLFTLNKGRLEIGKIAENDLLQSELALLRSRTALDGARLEYDRALASLRLAINQPIDADIDIEVSANVPVVNADTSVAVAMAMKNRSTVVDLQLQDVQAKRRVNDARLNNGLGATVNASYGYNATAGDVNQAYRNLLDAQRLSLSVQVPLVQWGVRSAEVQAAKADEDRVAATSRVTREQTAQDAHFAALQLSLSRRQLEISAKADTVAQKRYEVTYNRYVVGRITIDLLYQAQLEKDQALQSYVQSLRGYWLAWYRLRRLTLYDFATGEPIR